MSANTVVMLLTDARFPSGGHAYSAGMEQAIAWGDVVDLRTAESFVVGRMLSNAVMIAQVVASANVAVIGTKDTLTTAALLDQLDDEVDARLASRAGRAVSREQGRRFLRAVRGTWPAQMSVPSSVHLLTGRHSSVILGAATGYLGVEPEQSAMISLYDLVGSPVSAAVRLLGLDPVEAAALVARLVACLESVVCRAAADSAERTFTLLALLDQQVLGGAADSSAGARADLSWISWLTAPVSDLAAEAHLGREERLFAS